MRKARKNLSLFAIFSGIGIAFAACGTLEQDSEKDLSPNDNHIQLTAADPLHCPEGFTLDANGQLCSNATNAKGPFTVEMKKRCVTAGGGSACSNDTWSADLARRIRGTNACPPGATFQKGLCVEGTDAFGPFTKAHVEACTKAGGGAVCKNDLRWNAAFAASKLPNAPTPPPSGLPWKWVSGLDYGLRSDGCGGGHFKASRGGGKRVHRGLDLLLPVGANLYSPCDGWVETGSDSGGYGSYSVVYCKVPARVAGSSSLTVSFLYGHLSRISTGSGVSISAGQKVGEVGKTGNANTSCVNPHVHFEATVETNFAAAATEVDLSDGFESGAPAQTKPETAGRKRSMMESEMEPLEGSAGKGFSTQQESAIGIQNVSTLVSRLTTNCMNPLGFSTTMGLSYNSSVDPFVLLSCLAGNKPTLTKSSLQGTFVRWSSFYKATAFDVNAGQR